MQVLHQHEIDLALFLAVLVHLQLLAICMTWQPGKNDSWKSSL